MGFKEKGKFESIFDPQIQKMKYKIILKWFFPVLLLLIAYKIQKPHYNWDVVFYCGAIFNDTQHPEASRIAVIQAMKIFPLSHPRFIFQYEFIGILAIVYYFRNSLYLFFNPEKREI